MDPNNPFSAGAGSSDELRNIGDKMEPVAMDPFAILQRCWDIVKGNPGTVIGTVLICAVPSCAQNAAQQGMNYVEQADPDMQLPLIGILGGAMLISILVSLFLQLGSVRIYTRLVRGLDADVSMLFGEVRHYLPALAAAIVMGIGILVGFMLLIVPGIILALGLQFALYAMVDQELGPFDSLSESWRLTDGHKVTVFVVNFVIGILTLVFGCVTLGLGFVLLTPVVALTQGVMYHSLMHLQGPRPPGS